MTSASTPLTIHIHSAISSTIKVQKKKKEVRKELSEAIILSFERET